MNYITRLERENEALRQTLSETRARIIELQAYYMTSKFDGDNGYAFTRTDILPRLSELRALTQNDL